jgi:menaquinone-9 beta-reductase
MEMGFSMVSNRLSLKTDRKYDIAIAGGGLAGLALSILLARKGFQVGVFEKETYPFHKVCGEYISMESWDFLSSLGLPLENWNLPVIRQLLITAPDGTMITETLPLGGFGISRFKLDAALADIAKTTGVDLFENTKVHDIQFENGRHLIRSSAGDYTAAVACACFGKKSNLDVKWKRNFLRTGEANHFVGVKYHVRSFQPNDQIALHNFSGGYCGISKIEEGKYCFCYLTKSENLRQNNQSIPEMEQNVLKKNPVLGKLMSEMDVLFKEPLTISQISFAKKTQIENHLLCLGDAAGMITPLCGNGMSMALHASLIASDNIQMFLNHQVTRDVMEESYQKKWNQLFARRLATGRFVQFFFGNTFWSAFIIRLMKPFPFLVQALIRQTHGEQF